MTAEASTARRTAALCGMAGVPFDERLPVQPFLDLSATCQPTVTEGTGTRLTWNLWGYQWTPIRPGDHQLAVRATGGAGTVQTDKVRVSGPECVTALQNVTAQVA